MGSDLLDMMENPGLPVKKAEYQTVKEAAPVMDLLDMGGNLD